MDLPIIDEKKWIMEQVDRLQSNGMGRNSVTVRYPGEISTGKKKREEILKEKRKKGMKSKGLEGLIGGRLQLAMI